MLINLWYVAEWSNKVANKPVRVKLLGQQFVLFRDDLGDVKCLSDVCLHRGGSLSKGWTTHNGCVACPYHGWEFDGDGMVKHIPSLGENGKIPDRARIDAYPTEERYGLIWVFLGDIPDSKRYPIPPLPEYGDRNWRMINAEWTWKAEASRVVENGIDLAHTSFVHSQFGRPESAADNYIEKVETHDYWASAVNVLYPPKLTGGFGWRRLIRKDRQETRVTTTYWLPGLTNRLDIKLNKRMSLIMFDANTPIDENTTRTFALQFRSFVKSRLFDKDSERRLKKVFREDTAIVEEASPHYLPESLENELSVESDRFISGFRRMRRKHIEEYGWQIDNRQVKDKASTEALTIPCPGRRTHNTIKWVLNTVPLTCSRDTIESDEEAPTKSQRQASTDQCLTTASNKKNNTSVASFSKLTQEREEKEPADFQ